MSGIFVMVWEFHSEAGDTGMNEASRPIAVRTLLYILLSFSQNQNKKVWHFCLIFIGNFLEKHSIT